MYSIEEKWNICPVLLYYRFRKHEDSDVANCVSIHTFEQDMRKLLDAGYKSVSLLDIVDAKKYGRILSSKSFCIIFQGGYEDNFQLAFPVIRCLGIHVDIFVDASMVGLKKHPSDPSFLPRFNWEKANIMCSSKLVNIYAFCSMDNSNNQINTSEIEQSLFQISRHVKESNPKTSFYMNIVDANDEFHTVLKTVGITSYIVPFWLITTDRIKNGAIPFTCVNQESNIFDVIEEFNEKCSYRLKRDESLTSATKEYCQQHDEYENVFLPIEKKPKIRNYLRHAFPLSVLEADREDKASLFVLYEYIDVIFRPWYHWFDYDNSLYDSWDTLHCCKLSRDIIVANDLNIVDCIIKGLSMGYYSDAWVDTYFIPGKPGYKEYHLSHCLLVFGYDRQQNVFNTLTYTQNGQYEQLNVSPKDMFNACNNDYFLCLNLMKPNKEAQVVYKLDELITRIKRYFNSEYVLSNTTKYNKFDRNQLCNREACIGYEEYIIKTAQEEQRIYMVALYGFLEHKKCMGWRLAYILKRERREDYHINEYTKMLIDKTQICISLALKYNMTKNKKTLFRLREIIQRLNYQEEQILIRFFKSFNND